MEYEFVPVNKSVLVKPMKDDEYDKMIGMDPDEDKKVGSLFVPGGASPKEKHGMVHYAKGKVVRVNETEEKPFELLDGDTVVYNIGATIMRDEFGDPALDMVEYKNVIVVLRKKS